MTLLVFVNVHVVIHFWESADLSFWVECTPISSSINKNVIEDGGEHT
jgi:hypothetical protein